MKKFTIIAGLILSAKGFSQSYPPAAGQEGSTAISYDSELFVNWATTSQITRGYINIANPNAQDQGSNFASYGQDADAIGIADGVVVSLGDRGTAILTFEKPIANGPGFDFAVFENSFSDTFLEIAFVEVSSDGENYFRFPAHSQTQTETQVDGFGNVDPTYLNNFAGKYRAMFGTPFDLDDVEAHPLLDKSKITHVKLIDVVGSIDPEYASFDQFGNKVNDPYPTPFASSGFDLDAVGVINEGSLNLNESNLSKFKIIPNPALNYFQIQNSSNALVKIFNELGQIVLNQMVEPNEKIDIRTLESGIYFVQIQSNQKTTLHKLIKE
jgi:hypothetical protein